MSARRLPRAPDGPENTAHPTLQPLYAMTHIQYPHEAPDHTGLPRRLVLLLAIGAGMSVASLYYLSLIHI